MPAIQVYQVIVQVLRPNPKAVALAPSVLPDATSGLAYSQQLAVTGGLGTARTYTFTLVSGTLPLWATLSSTGLLSGLPPPYVVTWSPLTLPDGVVDTPYPATTITTTASMVSAATTFTVRAADTLLPAIFGEQTYTLTTIVTIPWLLPATFTSTRVPCLSLNPSGVLGGTPMQVGSAPFVVVATDRLGHTLSFTYTLTVRPKP